MSLRFSDQGPLFPAHLIDALLTGDVVFLCGTGISAPQLPTFQQLVNKVSEDLGVALDDSEILAFSQGRYEEVLGSIARRLANPGAMVRSAAKILAVPAEPRLTQHDVVLRLSRDIESRLLVVTTNFDTLLERALRAARPDTDVAAESFAGQALPAPGSSSFSGIIHLHGRLEDQPCSLEETPLVLTSADYGDAYMRSGWASRFLFDLARCKTIVLLGYSAGDAPVRYFLNVLEADRDRFPDLKPVYAFAPYVTQPAEAEAPWGTVGVTPIPYCEVNPETKERDHAPLWRDLAELATLVERPKVARDARLRVLLAKPASSMDDAVLAELRWLLSNGDPWPVVVDALTDPKWFKHFQDNGLWAPPQAQWTVSQWVARNLEDRCSFAVAVEWLALLGAPFSEKLNYLVGRATLSPFWLKAWRALTYAGKGYSFDFDDDVFTLKEKLESGLVLEDDIARAIEKLGPSLTFEKPYRGLFDDLDGAEEENEGEETAAPRRLSELARVEFGRDSHDGGAVELLEALTSLDDEAPRILRRATDALQSAAARAVDLDLAADDWDHLDQAIPSVEDHPQNEYHGGALLLVRVVVRAFEKVAAVDRACARRIAALWSDIPSRLGIRLQLHAMRNAAAFDADEAVSYLGALGDDDFWNIRREIAMLLVDRAGEADAALVAGVEHRIRETASAFYDAYEIDEGQPDWRPRARDNEVWLRLSQLARAGALSAAGTVELAEIKARRSYLDRDPEDEDFFSSYSYGVRSVVSDAEPILSAAPEDRLEVVHRQAQSFDIEQVHGWGAYCRKDPKGAFETLAAAPLTAENLALWSHLLSALTHGDETSAKTRGDIAVDAVAALAALGPADLTPVANSLVDLFYFGARGRFAGREDWYDRLWAAVCLDDREVTDDIKMASAAMNSPAGRLAHVLLQEHEASLKAGDGLVARQLARFRILAAEQRRAGLFARATFVWRLGALAEMDEAFVRDVLIPIIEGDADGPALRALLVTHGAITPLVSRMMPDILLKAIRDARPGHDEAKPLAAILLRPALAELRGDEDVHWGINATQVRALLRDVTAEVRRGTLNVLVQWMHAEEGGGPIGWQRMAQPFLDRIWPKERKYVDEANNLHLAELAMGSGIHFPTALATVRHFITPWTGRQNSIHRIKTSSAATDFPRQTLELLWLLFGATGPTSYDMPAMLDILIKADETIEIDRRLQSLEQRSVR